VLSDGTIQCWGLDISGELGNGATFPPGPPGTIGAVPMTVLDISTASAVAAGHEHTCALLGDGTVQCWGFNSYGSLGNGTFEYSLLPVSVLGITTAVAIAAGGYTSCALLSDGTVQCWGANMEGELGNGTMYYIGGQANSCSTPVTVAGITNAVGIAMSDRASCALLRGGTIQCWGFGYGYASSNSLTNMPVELSPDVPGYVSASALPATVQGVSNAISLSYGCAVLSNRTIQCWHTDAVQGTDSSGYSDPSVSGPPVVISGITNAVSVSGDVNGACMLLDGGRVQCWGTNGRGQLGDGTTTDSQVPVTVSGF
jgi:alpha-tubulin suppressor-like RCC1 family protein